MDQIGNGTALQVRPQPRGRDPDAYHGRALHGGVNKVLYVVVRALLQPFFHVYFRMRRHGMEHVPRQGPVIFAANHRSFLDAFVIGMLTRRPVYYVAKKELFERPLQAWFLNRLGAFPVERDAGDRQSMSTARAILARGDCVVIFPEGTRVRSGPLGEPRRGVGRLALETGAPVVPVAVHGSDRVRRGWLIRPMRVRVRCGRPLTFPRQQRPSPALAAAVTQRVWPCVELQWQWLGGEPPAPREITIEDTPGRARAA
ncbi:MAG: glycerol-3-phosphate dehydrogenase [Solirubrobacteraceae bacterium]|jgi:1-acyl-sn-glycerol-3-phosphate acyltransferase|nr:glycerol-3-phosphate dehydrogenase [Solirubrobacteraceae bacterium]